MSYQNINEYNFIKIGFRPVNEVIDISLVSDELNFDTETVYSDKLIAEDDGNRMPFNFDLNLSQTTNCINCGVFSNDIIISKNFYNPANKNLLLTVSTAIVGKLPAYDVVGIVTTPSVPKPVTTFPLVSKSTTPNGGFVVVFVDKAERM